MATTTTIETTFGDEFTLTRYDDNDRVSLGDGGVLSVRVDTIKIEESAGTAENTVWFYRNGGILDHMYVEDEWWDKMTDFLKATNVTIEDERDFF